MSGAVARLRAYFASHLGDPIACSFEEIEALIDSELPAKAWESEDWWAEPRHRLGEAWTDAGYRAVHVDLERGQVRFEED